MRLLFATFILITASTTYAQNKDPRRPAAIETAEVPVIPAAVFARQSQYRNVRAAGFAGWSPDGKGILIRTRFANSVQLHRVYRPGGRREQVTFFNEPVRGSFIPKDKSGGMLLSMSRGGNENFQVYYFHPSKGAVRLTDGKFRNSMHAVRRDGQQLIVASNKRNGRDTDLYLADPRQPNSLRLVYKTDRQFWYGADFSPDAKTLLLGRYVSINESYMALYSLTNKKQTDLPLPTKKKAAIGELAFSRDGKSVYLSTDARGEFSQLARLDLATRKFHWLSNDIPWDVAGLAIDEQSDRIVFGVNEDGASKLYLVDGKRRRSLRIPLGIASGLTFSPSGRHLGFSLSRPDAPTDCYSLEIATNKLTRWTFSEVGGLDARQFVRPRRIQYKTFDGRMIPAYYFRPKQVRKSKPLPVLIRIHGGPESQYRPFFNSSIQYYVNELGIAVIAPNVRGSRGYGKTYLKLDNGPLRENSVKDIGALLDWIADQPELDAKRVAVYGGSYGGYMVLGSLTHFGDRIRAGVDIVGIANFITFLKNTASYRRDLRRAEYGDERDPKMKAVFERINPTANADKIKSALLVAHGKNDPRVPFSEAQQIAEKVRSLGRPVWTVYAGNEGHGFGKKVNADYIQAVIAMFLRKHLQVD